MNIKGKLIEKFDTQQVSEKFRKREFVIEFAENQFTEFIKFELVQDKCELIDAFSLGNEIDVHFNLKGRSWVNKEGVKQYFNSLQAWIIKSVAAVQSTNMAVPSKSNEDDLPF